MNSGPALLLLTATINPGNNTIWSDRNDPAVRLQDYHDALQYYLQECRHINRLVFVENSAGDLTPLQQLAAQYHGTPVEFLSFPGQDYPAEYSRGYGELRSMDYAYQHSQLLAQLEPTDKCWKVTGRYQALNLDRLICTAPPNYDLYADFRYRKQQMDCRIFSFSRQGYARLLLGRYPEMTGIILERFLFQQFAPLVAAQGAAAGIIPELYYVPHIRGIGAYQNMTYHKGKLRLIYQIRSLLRSCQHLVRQAPGS
jgi:hypothetical protein